MKRLISYISLLMVMIGGCGIMNEAGNIQPLMMIIALVGALGIYFVSREVE